MMMHIFLIFIIGLTACLQVGTLKADGDDSLFTKDELKWIAENPVVKVAPDSNLYPYAFINDEGEYDGISRDFVEEIEQRSGLKFEYQLGLSWLDMLNGLKSSSIDLIPMVFFDQEKEEYIRFSTPYLTDSEYLLTLNHVDEVAGMDDLNGKLIGVIEGYEQVGWLEKYFPGIKLKKYREVSHALRAVSTGKIYGTIIEESSASYLINKLKLKSVKKNKRIEERKNIPIHMGVSNKTEELSSIINKALANINIKERNAIFGAWLKSPTSQITINGAFGYGRAPYMYGQGSIIGIEYDLVRRAFSRIGYNIGKSEQIPAHRGQVILNEDSDFDFSVGVKSLNDDFYYSEPLVDFNAIALTRNSDFFNIDKVSDLKGFKVSTFYEAHKNLGDEFEFYSSSDSENYKEYLVQEDSLKAFFTGGADVLIGDKDLILWTLKNSEIVDGSVDDYTLHNIFGSVDGFKVAFRDKSLRDSFNASLMSLKESSDYDSIVDFYMMSDFGEQIQRANLISEIVAPYILDNNVSLLKYILGVFQNNSNIKAVNVRSESPSKTILKLQEVGGVFKEVDLIDVSNLSELSKNSVIVNSGEVNKVGEVQLYFESISPKQIRHAYISDVSLFDQLTENQKTAMEGIYTRHKLNGEKLNLNADERAWIRNNPVVKIAVDPSALPYEAFDSDGSYIGIIPEYLQLISSSTGIVFDPVAVKNWDESLQLIDSRDVMMASAGYGNPRLELDYRPVSPIIDSKMAFIGVDDNVGHSVAQLDGKSVGIVKGASQTNLIMNQYPQIDWVHPDNSEDGVERVVNGEYFGMVDTHLVLGYMNQSMGYSNLRVVDYFDAKVASTFYVLKREPLLHSIINKSVKSITQRQKDRVVSTWVTNKYIEKISYTLVWQVAVVAALLVLVTLFWNRKLSLQVRAREEAELQIHKREELLLDMLNGAPIGVAIVQSGKAVFTNTTAREMYRISADALDEFNVSEIYCDVKQREDSYRLLKQGVPVVNKEIKFKRIDGTEFFGMASYLNTHFKNNPAVLFWCYDISDLRSLNDQLVHAKEDADQANRAKSDFLANMSHEIRTPMNAIIGMTHLSLNSNLDKKTRSYLNKVSHAAASLLGIINDILDFSKIEAGKLDMETLDVDLKSIIMNQVDLIDFKAKEKGVEVVIDVNPNVPNNLMGDPLRLGQIFTNLTSNAIKFTDRGEIVLSAMLDEMHSDKAKLRFSVKDSGVGISKENQRKLFKSFSQVDASTTREYGGTGLGLTICKRLVELMGGEIHIDSELGQGTEFIFTAWFELNPQRSQTRIESDPSSLDDLSVLVVDDNESAADIMASIVSSFGSRVTVVHGGQDAVQAVVDSPSTFDIAIVDWNMPEMDGIETCAGIRQASGTHAMHFIMVSAYDHARFKQRSEAAGIVSYLAKPVTSSAIFNEIVRISGRDIAMYTPVASEGDGLAEAKDKLVGAHLLLVEDNELNQELALELLASIGISADLAENGLEAVNKVQQFSYDGVLMDIQMPIMDGYTATQKIREFNTDLPIIAMTANAMAGDRDKVIKASMNDYISKPIDLELMILTMAQWFSASPGARDTADCAQDQQTRNVNFTHESTDTRVLDQQAGLANCNQNPQLYKKLLGKFLLNQAQFTATLSRAWAEGDWDLARRMTHTLKGNAGSIGALELYDSATELDQACGFEGSDPQGTSYHNSIERLETLLGHVDAALSRVFTEIRLISTDEPVAGSSSSAGDGVPVLTAALPALTEQIEGFDTAAIETLDELTEFEYPEPLLAIITQLSKAIAEYDFEAAMASLESLKEQL